MATASEQMTGGVAAEREHFFIGGEWVSPSSDKTFDLVNASTGRSSAACRKVWKRTWTAPLRLRRLPLKGAGARPLPANARS